MKLEDLDYTLPEELIAQAPLAERDASRLLVLDAGQTPLADAAFVDLPALLPPSLFVVNDTRVLPARLLGQKASGGAVELLLVEQLASEDSGARERWLALGRTSKGMRPGLRARFGELDAELLGKRDEGYVEVELSVQQGDVESALERAGQMPLPPYVRRAADASDRERYQTVFARTPGAVAAPTASLHFTPRVLAALEAAGHRLARVTLHVGPGTFRPVKSATLDEHVMHEERWEVSPDAADAIARARDEGRPVTAVGTTVVRTLESAASEGGIVRPGSGRTNLFIRPPYRAKVVDHLVTNFHLPRSTLLALVFALGGEATVRAAYAHAVAARYRFFSYGDAMLIRGIRGIRAR